MKKGREITERERFERLAATWRNEDLSLHQGRYESKLSLFLYFVPGFFLFVSGALIFLWYLLAPRFAELHHLLPAALLSLMAAAIFSGFVYLLIFYAGFFGRDYSFFRRLLKVIRARAVMARVVDLVRWFGSLFGISRDHVADSFVQLNNIFSLFETRKNRKSVLALLPSCIQHFDCKQRGEVDAKECKECDLCSIPEMDQICRDHSVQFAVAYRGKVANELIVQTRPEAVIAVACERELLVGISEACKVPVFGISNFRPEGPCLNAKVDLREFQRVVENFQV